MMNLFYRGYVIHEDIRSICYTIFGAKPHRAEIGSRSTTLEAMRWVDRDLAQLATVRRACQDSLGLNYANPSSPVQPALL